MIVTKKSRGALLATTSTLALLLAGCSSATPPSQQETTHSSTTADGDHHAHGDHGAATELPHRAARLLVATDTGVTVLSADLDILSSVDLPQRPTLTTTGDDRHVAAVMTAGNEVAIIDGGTWAEPHGDHFHYYAVDPSLLEHRFTGTKPVHVVPNPDSQDTTIFFDGDAEGVLLDPTTVTGSGEPRHIHATAAHHGVIVPLSNGQVLLSQKGKGLADTIDLLDADGTHRDTFPCTAMHGEAVVANTALFGCADSILEVTDGTARSIPAPDASGERVGGIVLSADGTSALGDWGDTTLVLVTDGTATILDTPVAYSNRVALPHGGWAYLGVDGQLRLLDAAGTTTRTIAVTSAWTKPDGHGGVAPSIAAGQSDERAFVWVSEPSTNTVYRVEIDSGEVTSTTVPGQPASLATSGGAA